MSDDLLNNITTPSSPLTVDQLIKLQATNSSAHMEIELCYSKLKAYVKPLKMNDKKELLKAMENKNENLVNKVFDNIIAKYVTIEGMENGYDDLVLQERFQLLTYIRVANGDPIASLVHMCPSCEKANKSFDYDLENLSVKLYENDGDDIVLNEIIVDGQEVATIRFHIKPLTRTKEKITSAYINSEKVDTDSEKYMVHMASCIHKVDVVTGGQIQQVIFEKFSNKVDYFKTLDGIAEEKIKKIINKFDFGAKMSFDFECQHCGYKEKNEEVNIVGFFIS